MGEPMTQERLKRYIWLEPEIEDLRERVAQKSAKAQFPAQAKGGESQYQQGTGDQRERGIIKYMMDKEDAEAKIAANLKEKAAIEAAIEALPNPQERTVMRCYYLDRDKETGLEQKWAAVAKKLYGKDEERHIKAAQRLCKSALKHLAMVNAEGKEKSHP